MSPNTLQTREELPDSAAADVRLNVSVEHLEALTALAASATDPRAVGRLLEDLAETVTRLTDYRACLFALFTDEPPYNPRVISYSASVPAEYAERVASASHPRAEVERLVEGGVHIEAGGLGFAAYYPPTRHALLGTVFPDRHRPSDASKRTRAPRGARLWSEGDALFVPVVTPGGEHFGLISLDDPRSGLAPDRQSVLPVVAFARQVAQLLERQRDADALAHQVEREALINRITLAVRRSLDPEEVFHAAVEEMGVHLAADRCTLYMLDHAAGLARKVAEYDAHDVAPAGGTFPIPLLQDLIDRIIRRGVLTFDDTANDPSIRSVYENILKRMGTRSIMYAAVTVGDETRGAFAISTLRERRWRESDVALARAVADQAGIAIRQAELFEMVARGKQTWEATFDAMSDGVFIFDGSRRLARVNRAGAALESVEPREMLGRGCCDVLRAEGGDGCLVERVEREGRGLTLEYTPAQLGRTLLVTAEPITLGPSHTGTVCTVRDLSELRHVERLARERQSILENVLESARESICAISPDGKVLWANSASTAVTGLKPEELIGRDVFEMVDEEQRPSLREQFRLALEGTPQTVEARLTTPDGHVRHVLSDTTPLVIEGRATGVLAISRDVTEQKLERERAAQADKLRALGQLASGVAHDFNNALAAIIGRAQLLRRRADAESARGLDVILKAAEDAAATVRRIRAFARPAPVERTTCVDVAELLRDAAEITRTRWENEARARGLSYEVRVEAERGCTAVGDASELREVFVNLIFNALDAMPRGGRLTIACAGDAAGTTVLFSDTGTGMTEEVRERIFEPFYTTKGTQGTGLGLFVSYGIVERHGGRIGVETEPGRGSTFRIALPRAQQSQAACDVAATRASAGRLRVLVVDDEKFVRETLVEMVEALGHEVSAAESGAEALALVESHAFDVVFSDLSMPRMDGWELARELRRRAPATRVCIVTGYGGETQPPEGSGASADALIGKPFNFDQVEETLAQLR